MVSIWHEQYKAWQWRHNGHDGISNHQPHHCLLNHLFGRRSKKTSELCITGLCAGNSLRTGEFPAQMASNVENVSIWWRHHRHGRKVPTVFLINNVAPIYVTTSSEIRIKIGNFLFLKGQPFCSCLNLLNIWVDYLCIIDLWLGNPTLGQVKVKCTNYFPMGYLIEVTSSVMGGWNTLISHSVW